MNLSENKIKIQSDPSIVRLKKPIKIMVNRQYVRNLQLPSDEILVNDSDELKLKLDRLTGSQELDTADNYSFLISYNRKFQTGMILSAIVLTFLALTSAFQLSELSKTIITLLILFIIVAVLTTLTVWKNHWIVTKKVLI